MQFLRNLLYTRRPSLQMLLDAAIVLSIVPHLFVLKSFTIAYLFFSLWFILKKNKSKYDSLVLFTIGGLSIVLSFFSTYNFSDFSRMQFFVSLISSLLILAVTLQRATGIINVYLKISPIMLLMLSFFFFDTIEMLFYSLFVFFIFILISIWLKMRTSLIDVLKFNFALFLLSLPLVVILFISFPRISFKKADFGFRSDRYSSNVYSKNMNVSDLPFKPSSQVVMEVFFEDGIPDEKDLYFRGSTLFLSEKFQWKENNNLYMKEQIRNLKGKVTYTVVQNPHGEKWLYPIGLPVTFPQKVFLQNDHTLETEKPIYQQKRLKLGSVLQYSLFSGNPESYMKYNAQDYPKTFNALEKLKDSSLSLEEKASKLLEFFQKQKIAYSINPKGLDPKNIIDSFLFDAKNGYCTHFSSSFAIAARIIGIPSRVVSGYKANYESRVENYLLVKQKDAHAWVELYLPKKGWVRFEPTATHYRVIEEANKKRTLEESKLFQSINNQYMYMKYLITNWVLGFDRLKQMKILESLLNDTFYLLKFSASIIALVLVCIILFQVVRSWGAKSKLDLAVKSLLKILSRKKIHKEKNESMEKFLNRAESKLNLSLYKLIESYHILKYSKEKGNLEQFNEEIKRLKKQLR